MGSGCPLAAAAGKDAPIGVFDSGVGGLTVARALIDQLPHESLLYVGDGAHGPYGNQSLGAVREHSIRMGDYLRDQGCKAIVIACNTATAASYELFQQRYEVPVFEVITSAVRRAEAATHNGRVGVIATQATVESGAYERVFRRDVGDREGFEVTSVACPKFVDFVERGVTSGRQVLGLAEGYLTPLQQIGVDTLVLGCTHYPLLSAVIQMAMGQQVTLVSSAEETAKDVVRVLTEQSLLVDVDGLVAETGGDGGRCLRFETTGDPVLFSQLATRFLGSVVGHVEAAGLADNHHEGNLGHSYL